MWHFPLAETDAAPYRLHLPGSACGPKFGEIPILTRNGNTPISVEVSPVESARRRTTQTLEEMGLVHDGWFCRRSTRNGTPDMHIITKALRVLIALLALTLFAAACGSDAVDTAVADAADNGESMTDDTMEDDTMEDDTMEDDTMEDDTMEDDTMEDDTMEDDTMEDDTTMADDGTVRIVSLSPTATEMLFAIGAGDLVVAVDDFSNYPPEAPMTDLSGFTPNIEAIASYEPTLVVSQAPIEGLDALGIENIVQFAAVSFDDVYAQMNELGAATGFETEAAEASTVLEAEVSALKGAVTQPEVPLTYYHELDTTLFSVTSDTFIGEVYKTLGLVNIADAHDPDGFSYPQLSEEIILTENPDLIFLADTKWEGQSLETVRERPGWSAMTAVEAGNVFELDDDIASRWGPRILDFMAVVVEAVNKQTVNAG